MTRSASPKLAGYAGLSAVGLLAALAFARPELVALTTPFLLALAAGLALATPPRLTARRRRSTASACSRETRSRRTSTSRRRRPSTGSTSTCGCPRASSSSDGANPVALRLAAGEQRELDLTLRAARWGGHLLGPLYVRARDPLGFLVWEADGAGTARSCARTRAKTCCGGSCDRATRRSSRATRSRGARARESSSPTSVPGRAGDPLNRINWRASARRSELWVNESHPERNTDVILFVDSFAEARLGDEGTLDLTVRATATLADAYVRRRDRVGLISFGGILRWLAPGTGIVQLYRIVDALLDTEIVLSYYWKEIDVIPRRTLPPNALVIALSPLLDPALGRRAARPARARLRPRRDRRLARAVHRATAGRARRGRLRHLDRCGATRSAIACSVPGSPSPSGTTARPLQAVVEEVRAFRRYARHARV